MDIVWTVWLLLIASSFAALESYALTKNKTTLSRHVWNASRAWPLLPFVVGAMCGGLAVHFWWHWCP
jgi:uncharacterized membrane protein YoaK (UPF0700 family)